MTIVNDDWWVEHPWEFFNPFMIAFDHTKLLG
jgi:hypothetical protein